MTWANLKSQCINLGFTKQKDYDKNKSSFIEAANWAQNYLAQNVRPILGKKIINHRSLDNIIDNSLVDLVLYEGDELIYTAKNAKSYYFECDGTGIVTVKDDNGSTMISMTSEGGFNAYKGFCSGGLTLIFSGDYAYSIQNLAAYGALLGPAVSDIPTYGEYVSYDLKALDTTFLGFALEKPVFRSGGKYRYVGDYKREEGHIVLFSREERGQFEMWYKKYPTPITLDTPDGFVLELDTVVLDIMPYLMGYRLWLDDDSQKAVLYYNTANDLINELRQSDEAAKVSPMYIDTAGCIVG